MNQDRSGRGVRRFSTNQFILKAWQAGGEGVLGGMGRRPEEPSMCPRKGGHDVRAHGALQEAATSDCDHGYCCDILRKMASALLLPSKSSSL